MTRRKGTDVNPSRSHRLLGATFVAAGSLHFVAPGLYERIMPPYLPLHRELVYLPPEDHALGRPSSCSGYRFRSRSSSGPDAPRVARIGLDQAVPRLYISPGGA
jgi:hypothetical protein